MIQSIVVTTSSDSTSQANILRRSKEEKEKEKEEKEEKRNGNKDTLTGELFYVHHIKRLLNPLQS